MSYYKDMDLIPEERERNVSNMYKKYYKIKDALEDFVLEQDHMKECSWVWSFGQHDVDEECSCMDRSHYNYNSCLERAEKLLKDLK